MTRRGEVGVGSGGPDVSSGPPWWRWPGRRTAGPAAGKRAAYGRAVGERAEEPGPRSQGR
ncbi:hypothetical protein [Microbispora hainanensis]|uniref:Uncharacterized protein n=1 Tax=Microbispora hainanensis TaxID=568844 RepID=A0ABZ1SY14_9ACTN|nr:hypothetical protein [Microbispora hainanensis]